MQIVLRLRDDVFGEKEGAHKPLAGTESLYTRSAVLPLPTIPQLASSSYDRQSEIGRTHGSYASSSLFRYEPISVCYLFGALLYKIFVEVYDNIRFICCDTVSHNWFLGALISGTSGFHVHVNMHTQHPSNTFPLIRHRLQCWHLYTK